MNSEWIAAIDNAGETLCLHSSASVQLIPKLDMNQNIGQQHSPASASSGSTSTNSNERPEMQLISELHFYSGLNWNQHTLIQIGHLCPDEILDLELDSPYDHQTQNEDMNSHDHNVKLGLQEVLNPTNPFNVMNPGQNFLQVEKQ